MKFEQFFTEFLDEKVNLNPTRLERLTGSVDAVNRFLSTGLPSFQRMERQGSYGLGTIIKPVNDGQEFDADLLVYMKYDDGKSPKDYIAELYDYLKENGVYTDKVHRHTRSVEIDYAGDFHLDLVPCIATSNGRQFVCNRQANEFEPTDGTGYREWFNNRTRITHGNLKRVTRILKYMRDHKGNFAVKSILLTTLIGNTVLDESDGENFRTLPDALKTVCNRINDFLQKHPFMPEISNPVLPGESFNRHWTQISYDNFRNLFKVYNDRVNKAYESRVHDESVDLWRGLFGGEFGKKVGESGHSSSGKAASGAAITLTPRKPWA